MKRHKSSSLIGMVLVILLTCLLGACSTSQNTGKNNLPPETNGAGRLWRTSDGFRNWQLLNEQIATDGNKMKALSFVGALCGWGITDTKLFHTPDGGRTWSEIVYHITELFLLVLLVLNGIISLLTIVIHLARLYITQV